VLGKHSGTRAVKSVYARLGHALGDREADALLGRVRQFVVATKRAPDDDDLLRLFDAVKPEPLPC